MSDVGLESALLFKQKDRLFLRPDGAGGLTTEIVIRFNGGFEDMLLLKMSGTCPVRGFPKVVRMEPGVKPNMIKIKTEDSAVMRNKLVKNRVTLKWIVVPQEFREECLKYEDQSKELLWMWEKTYKMSKAKQAHRGFDLVFSENEDVGGTGDAGIQRKDKVPAEQKSGEKTETTVDANKDQRLDAKTSVNVNLANVAGTDAHTCVKVVKEHNSPEKCKRSVETAGPISVEMNSRDASAPESSPASERTLMDVSSGNGIESCTSPAGEGAKLSADVTKNTELVPVNEDECHEVREHEEQCEVKKLEMTASTEDEALEFVKKKTADVRQMMLELFGSSSEPVTLPPKWVDLVTPEASAGSSDVKAVGAKDEAPGPLDSEVSGDVAELPSEPGDLSLTKTNVVPDRVLSEWGAVVNREPPNEDLISACSETTVEVDGNVYSVVKAYTALDDPMDFLEKLPLADTTSSVPNPSPKSSGQKCDSRGKSSAAVKDQKDRQIKALRENVQFKDRVIEDLRNKLKTLTEKCKDKDASTIDENSSELLLTEIGDEDASLRKSEEIPCTELTSAQIQVTSLQENATGLPKCEIIQAGSECTFRSHKDTLISPLFVDWIRDKTVHPFVCLRLRHSGNHMYRLQVCFPKIRDGVDLSIGTCFLQIKLLASDSFPVGCYHFIFDARNGTCFRTDSAHSDKFGCDSSTYTSPACISLRNVNLETVDGRGDRGGVLVNAEVRIMLMCMRNCLEEEVDVGYSFQDKVLTDLALWSQGYGYPVMRKVTFICGPDLDFQKTVGEYVLRGSSPIFEALLEENIINGKGVNVYIRLSYVSARTMVAVCDYLYGRTIPVDWNDIDLTLSVLLFSSFFLMVDLALKCTQALLNLRDEDLELEKVIAIIEAGRKFGFVCLVNRGKLWLQKEGAERCQQGLLAIESAIPAVLSDSTEIMEDSSKLEVEKREDSISVVPVESQCNLYKSKWDTPLRRSSPTK